MDFKDFLFLLLKAIAELLASTWHCLQKAKRSGSAAAICHFIVIFMTLSGQIRIQQRIQAEKNDKTDGVRPTAQRDDCKMCCVHQWACALPSRCVQMFPVSVWILKMLLKQARNEGIGGLWPWSRKSLSFSQSGSTSWGITRHLPSHIWFVDKRREGKTSHLSPEKQQGADMIGRFFVVIVV